MILIRRETIERPATQRPRCELTGECGPFLNEGYYNAFPEALWHGMGDCVHCGTTRKVAANVAIAAQNAA